MGSIFGSKGICYLELVEILLRGATREIMIGTVDLGGHAVRKNLYSYV